MKLIVGLGNPGKKYYNTRHNIGFMVIDNYCNNEKFSKKFNGEYIIKEVNGKKAIFLKPLSYMNLSGTVVSKFKNYFGINNEDIMIIHDDLDLNLGTAKLKYNSSSGGDNGVKSIIECLNSQSFLQYKIGISNDKKMDTKDYVLGKLSKRELELLDNKIEESVDIISFFIENNYLDTMNKYNGIIKWMIFFQNLNMIKIVSLMV